MFGRRWLAKLPAHDPAPVERALDKVHASPGGAPLEAGAVREALAASEVVAASLGRPSGTLPSEAHALVERCAGDLRKLREKARAVLERIGGLPEQSFDARDVYDEPDGAAEGAAAAARRWRTEMDLLSLQLADD
jgi:hypothetical protein